MKSLFSILITIVFFIACKKTDGGGLPTPTIKFQKDTIVGTVKTQYANVATSSDPNDTRIIYSSNQANDSVLTVDKFSGNVYGYVAGKYTVIATQEATSTHLAAKSSYTLIFDLNHPTLTFKQSSYSFVVGLDTGSVKATSSYVWPIRYSIDKTNIAKVDSVTGKIIPIAVGTAIVTATMAAVANTTSQATATCNITVGLRPDPVPTIKFQNPTGFAIGAGCTGVINVATSSIGTSGGIISYSSSNPSIATVNNSSGAVTGIAIGTVSIMATEQAKAGFNQQGMASYTLTVQAPSFSTLPGSLTLDYYGSAYNIPVSANTGCTLTTNQSWCRASNSGLPITSSIIISADKNTSTTSRTAIVTVTVPGLPTKTINITQQGMPTNPYINISVVFAGKTYSGGDIILPSCYDKANGTGGFVTVTVNSNVHWVANPITGKVSASGSGVGNGIFQYTFGNNAQTVGTPSRQDGIRVSADGGTPNVTLTVCQY